MVGDKGTVYAIDIHQLAIEAAANIAQKNNLKKVRPLLIDGTSVNVPPRTADDAILPKVNYIEYDVVNGIIADGLLTESILINVKTNLPAGICHTHLKSGVDTGKLVVEVLPVGN